jgi:hypothetical protein
MVSYNSLIFFIYRQFHLIPIFKTIVMPLTFKLFHLKLLKNDLKKICKENGGIFLVIYLVARNGCNSCESSYFFRASQSEHVWLLGNPLPKGLLFCYCSTIEDYKLDIVFRLWCCDQNPFWSEVSEWYLFRRTLNIEGEDGKGKGKTIVSM